MGMGYKLRNIVIALVFALLATAGFGSVASAQSLPGPSAQSTMLPGPAPATTSIEAPSGAVAPTGVGTDANYTLGTGDKLKVTVYGEPDLSGDFVVDGSGQVGMPLVGQVKAAGLTIHEFVAEVTASLSQGYLKDPKVSVEVENFRPFFILGEVNKPGEYPYQSGINALDAIALAGGFTYRADDSQVFVRRNGSSKELELPADASTKIYPGDIMRVAERIF
jgi:protein involved in polysaccharide export with SLBB domain